MPTRQYIGARYVPKFYENSLGTNEWTANTAYEPLTVVTRNGNSYTSKKLVPASVGAPESFPEYWASTGIYNAQIDEYRDEVQNVVNDLAALEAATQKKRRFILIADSYGVGVTNSAVQGNGWTYYFKNRLSLSNDDCIISQNGGAGFVVPSNTFLTLLNNTENNVTDPDGITDVIVGGGFNDATYIDTSDASTSTALRNAISAFYTRMKALYPNANIWLAFMARTIGHSIARINNTKQAEAIYDAFVFDSHVTNIANDVQSYTAYYGGAEETNINHFNQSGYNYIGYTIANAVMYGSYKPAFVRYGQAATSADNDVTAPATINYIINNRTFWLSAAQTGLTFGIGANKPTAESLFKLCDVSAPFWGRGAGATSFFVSGYFRRSGGTPTYENFTGNLVLDTGRLYIRMTPINAEGSSFSDLTTVDQIRVIYISESLPIDNMW